MAQTKDELAYENYGCDFEDLEPGEKAAITKKYNAQPKSAARKTARPVRATTGSVVAKIGRMGNGPVKEFILPTGATVGDLLSKSKESFDDSKDNIHDMTGNSVSLDDVVRSGETYIITVEIKSA